MKIIWAEFEGFKSFSEKTRFDFNQKQNVIIGRNGAGKSSIAEGIVYTIYGRTLDGRSKLTDDVVNLKFKEKNITMKVCLQDPDTYEKRIISRIKNIKGGQEIFLDDELITQDSIIGLFGPGDVFLSIFYNPFFMGLDDSEKRKIIESVTPQVDYEEIFKQKADINLIEKYDIKIYDQKAHKSVKKDIEVLQKEIDSLITEIEILEKQNLEIKECEFEQTYLEEEEKLKSKIKSASEIKNQKRFLQDKINNNVKIEEEIKSIQKTIQELGDPGEIEDVSEINKMANDYISKQNENIQSLMLQLISPSSYPSYIDGSMSECPTCFQPVSKEYTDSVNAKIAETINLSEQKNAEINLQIKKCKELIAECSKRRDCKISEINNKEAISAKIKNLQDKIEYLQLNIYQIKEEDKKVLEFDKIDIIENEYEKLFNHNREAEMKNSLIKNEKERKENNLTKIDSINKKINVLSSKMQELKLIESAINPSFLHKKAIEKKMESIKKHLNHADIELYKQQKNGEWKETFDIYFYHKPYRRLSFSEQMRCGLEISNMLNKVSGNNFPIFIDNTESISNIEINKDNKSQIFLGRFKEDADLKVCDSVSEEQTEKTMALV